LDEAIGERHRTEWRRRSAFGFPYVEVLIVDEADRLKTAALETLRDL
jgi:DNA transposition AAA+ family ATPase